MKFPLWTTAAFGAFLFFYPSFLTAASSPSDAEREKIASRAAEIAENLTPGANRLIPPISDRAAWEAFGKLTAGQKFVESAEKLLQEPIPECPEELYKEFFRNGNRSNAQRALGRRGSRIRVLALAELIENKGRFLPALEESLRDFCAYPSWVLPAHDANGTVYDGKHMSADLVSTHYGASLAMIRLAMKEVLSPETSELIVENVKKRVLAPYEKSVREGFVQGMWWINGGNNWNTVCHNGTLCAALSIYDDPQTRGWFLASTEHFVSDYFFRGFTEDGYCSEGMSYWNYGYGNFAELAEIMLRTTGTLNLFDLPKARAVSLFGPYMEIKPGFYAAFADCPVSARPSGLLLSLLSRRQGLGLTEIEDANPLPNPSVSDMISIAVYAFPPSDGRFDRKGAEAASPLESLRTDFADAQILICRAPKNDPKQLAAVIKGGHNAELHNHNDVGSFGILFGKHWMTLDPGGETYTQRTFSARRYEGELLNSFGHPVPRIDGALQNAGAKSRAVVLEKTLTDEKDTFVLDLTSAYPAKGLLKATRSFEFIRAKIGEPNAVVLTDTVEFAEGSAGTFETALITYAEAEEIPDETGGIALRISQGGDAVIVTVHAVDGDQKPIIPILERRVVGENDAQVPKKPTRLGFALPGKVGRASITAEIRPDGK